MVVRVKELVVRIKWIGCQSKGDWLSIKGTGCQGKRDCNGKGVVVIEKGTGCQ